MTMVLDSMSKFSTIGNIKSGRGLGGEVKFSDQIGQEAQKIMLEEASFTKQDGDTLIINGTNVTFGINYQIDPVAGFDLQDFVDYLNNEVDVNLSQAYYSIETNSRGALSLTMTNKVLGSQKDDEMSLVVNNFSNNLITPKIEEMDGVSTVLPVDRFSHELIGNITNISANFIEGDSESNRNMIRLNAIVNDTLTYSADIALSGSGSLGSLSGAENTFGNFIASGQKIELVSNDGTNKIILNADDSMFSIMSTTGTANTLSDIKNICNNYASMIQDALSAVSFAQERHFGSFDEKSVQGTVLNGLSANNIMITKSSFDDSNEGNAGSIEKFSYDMSTETLSVKIGANTYSQSFAADVAAGGLNNRFDSINEILLGGYQTTISLKDTDGNMLSLNLQNVQDIELNNSTSVNNFLNALNAVFEGQESNGLTFQTGPQPEQKTVITFPSLLPNAIYLDKAGNYVDNLNVSTKQDAEQSLIVLQDSLFELAGIKASIGATISQFSVVIDNLTNQSHSMENSLATIKDIAVTEAQNNVKTQLSATKAAVIANMQAFTLHDNLMIILNG